MLILALHRSKIQVLIASDPSDNIVTLEQPEGQCWNVTIAAVAVLSLHCAEQLFSAVC